MAGILGRHKHAARLVLESIAKVRGNPTAEAPYGLSGGNALIAWQLSSRRTLDTVAFSNRRLARDAADMAELLTRFTAGQLIALARQRDPGLQDADFADAGLYVDRARDEALASVLEGTGRSVGWLRRQLKDWPRTARPRASSLPR